MDVSAAGWPRAVLLFVVLLFASGLGACTSGQLGEFALVDKESKADSGFSSSLAAEKGAQKKGSSLRLPSVAEPLASAATPGSTAYKIGPQDILDISVFKVPELARNVQVADTGTINMPLLGEVPAAGKTARQMEQDLSKRLVKYLQTPQVTVQVREYNSQRITVEGAFKSPGVHVLKGKTSLLQVVAISGGLVETSDSTVVVFRNTDGKRYAARFEIDPIRKGDAEDPPILAGDVVVANSSAFKAAWSDFMKTLPVASFAMLLF